MWEEREGVWERGRCVGREGRGGVWEERGEGVVWEEREGVWERGRCVGEREVYVGREEGRYVCWMRGQ